MTAATPLADQFTWNFINGIKKSEILETLGGRVLEFRLPEWWCRPKREILSYWATKKFFHFFVFDHFKCYCEIQNSTIRWLPGAKWHNKIIQLPMTYCVSRAIFLQLFISSVLFYLFHHLNLLSYHQSHQGHIKALHELIRTTIPISKDNHQY